MKKIYTLIFGMMIITSSFAQQQHRICATMDVDARLRASDPEYAAKRSQIDEHARAFAESPQAGQRILVTIPVVFHVVYNTTAQNLSDAKLQSQIDILNEDFRKLNNDFFSVPSAFQGVGADMEFQFCLATVDPSGNPTTGITRTSTTATSFSTNDNVKYASSGGHDAWDRNKYLNIWVCNISNGILGYAQFPGSPAATDGVVLLYSAVGNIGATAPYNLGRTATHEIGHWLNLNHIWGDNNCGDDQVSDTPTQQTANYGCKTFPYVTCNNGPNGDMFMNFMDYGDDACLKMFTNGQKTRSQSLFTAGGSRVSLLTSNACTFTPIPTVACADTLNYPLTGTVGVIGAATVPDSGYVGGVNSYGDVAKVDKFTATAPITSLTGARLSFGIATQGTAPAGSLITVKAYAYSAAGPTTVLASTTIPLSTIIANVNAGSDTYVSFASPVTVPGNFFLGIEFDPTAGYTLALKSNSDGDVTTNTAWEQFGDLSWHQFSEANPTGWGISVNQAIFPILTSQPVLSINNNGVISSSVTVGSFQWFLNGVPISGATSSTYTPSQTGIYTVTVSNNTSNNCIKTSTGISYTSNVGIFDANGVDYINIYPNPANDILTIQTGFHSTQEQVVCKLFDLSGKLVYQRNYENVQPDALLQVELLDVSNGMYQVVISTSAGQSVSRVAVAH